MKLVDFPFHALVKHFDFFKILFVEKYQFSMSFWLMVRLVESKILLILMVLHSRIHS